ncbi:MAG: metallophosphoesterase family protein [Planctomycetota bacterium]
MRILLVADIHGNYRALQAVLEKFGGADEIWCLGDIVACGPMSPECVELVKKACKYVVRGNHDTGESVPGEAGVDLAYLESLPATLSVEVDGAGYLLAHNLPGRDDYVDLSEGRAPFEKAAESMPEDVLLFGHSHTAFILDVGRKLFVNAGTVGQPRDGDARAQCMLLENGLFRFERVEYDLAALEADFRRTRIWRGQELERWIRWTISGTVEIHGLQLGPFSNPPRYFER